MNYYASSTEFITLASGLYPEHHLGGRGFSIKRLMKGRKKRGRRDGEEEEEEREMV